MCQFIRGVILKNRIVMDGEANSIYEYLLHGEDTAEEFMDKYARVQFVRIQLTPPNDEWWTNPDTWIITVNQDIIPEWFKNAKGDYVVKFRKAAKIWWGKHVFVNQKVEELNSGCYWLKQCEVKILRNNVAVYIDDSTVKEMYNNSTIRSMSGNSVVEDMYDSSTIWDMFGNSAVERMNDSSIIHAMYEDSSVQKMYNHSTVQNMYNNSIIQEMCGDSIVESMRHNSTIQKMRKNAIAKDVGYGAIRISSECSLEIIRC